MTCRLFTCLCISALNLARRRICMEPRTLLTHCYGLAELVRVVGIGGGLGGGVSVWVWFNCMYESIVVTHGVLFT